MVTTELELSRAEKKAYNGLITVIKRNLILAECGGSRVDSLLYQKNRKYALEAINNARKACCLAGQFLLEIVRAHLQECVLDMRRGHSLHEHGCQCNGSYFDVPTLKQKFHTTRSDKCPLLEDRTRVVPEHRVKIVEEAFAGVGGSSGARAVVNTHDGHIKCDACSRLSVFPFITPCAHMICIDCVDSNSQQVLPTLAPSGLSEHTRNPKPWPLSCSNNSSGYCTHLRLLKRSHLLVQHVLMTAFHRLCGRQPSSVRCVRRTIHTDGSPTSSHR